MLNFEGFITIEKKPRDGKREQRLQARRKNRRARLARETEEERQERLASERKRRRARIQRSSDEEKQRQLALKRQRRRQESNEQRKRRLEYHRQYVYRYYHNQKQGRL